MKPATDNQAGDNEASVAQIFRLAGEAERNRVLLAEALPTLRGARDLCLRRAVSAKGVDDHAVLKHTDDAKVLSARIVKIEAALAEAP